MNKVKCKIITSLFFLLHIKMPKNKSPVKSLIATPIAIPVTEQKLQKLCKLGGGTYGTVYLCKDVLKNQEYAVKRNYIHSKLDGTIGTLRELDILTKVKEHPFCLFLKACSLEIPYTQDGDMSPPPSGTLKTDSCFFILEKGTCDADTYLHSKHSKDKKPAITQKKNMMVFLLLACEYIHSRGIMHRDIKPANIICFINSDQTLASAKLADFGLAQYWDNQMLSTPNVVTAWYRAPEIALGKDYDYKIDIWSLGCIFFEMFSYQNKRLMNPNSNKEIILQLTDIFSFNVEDKELSKILCSVKKTGSNDLKNFLACPISEIASFDSTQIAGIPNFGKYDEFVDCLSKMLEISETQRFTSTQCLNHHFFDGYRGYINHMRTLFEITMNGNWILEPQAALLLTNNSLRKMGMKWFKYVYNNKNIDPVKKWYTHQIMFHAIEMFDRYLTLISGNTITTNINIDAVEESTVVIWVNTFLFISTKYFRVLKLECGLDNFIIGIDLSQFEFYKSIVIEFEKVIIKDIFKFSIYRTTLFEASREYMNNFFIHKLLSHLINGQFEPGTSLSDIINYI